MQLSDNLLDQWEGIIASVSKTDVPLECIKKMVFKLPGGKQKTVNIHNLAKQGLSFEEIATAVSRTMADIEYIDIDFVVDIKSVASLVQPETDKILSKL